MANIRKAVDMHGLELVVGTTPYMREIFTDSLQRHCNVCNGCFKTLYTLSINLAVERGIGYIFTGLARGQLFETRLAPELFVGENFSIERIDADVDALRRDYHQRRDAVTEHLDVRAFDDPTLFQRVRIIDFYRYWDVELEEILDYLAREVAWLRPEDTGRSSNCLINDAGISVHTRRRGYHNYALPYSWDVRLGHKTREEAIAELEDRIDPAKVSRILGEIGYELPEDGASDTQLIAYIEASGDLPQQSLRMHLEQRLPAYMLPARYVRVPSLPLTAAGKVDRKALARLAPGDHEAADYMAPRNDLEAALTQLWQEVLGIARIGVEDNFFDLGGTSLPALQIVARVKDLFHIDLPLRALFSAPTVAGLAENVEAELLTQLEAMSDEQAERLLRDH
jgi:acyl carrier protein/DNA-binding transcriptional ArsR family regulator